MDKLCGDYRTDTDELGRRLRVDENFDCIRVGHRNDGGMREAASSFPSKTLARRR